jgi:hypothetical protein
VIHVGPTWGPRDSSGRFQWVSGFKWVHVGLRESM